MFMQAALHFTAQQTIQAILSPALMISATGLLLLGLNNRYTNVANRIRALNDEKRRFLKHQEGKPEFDYFDTLRLESITQQINSLFTRSSHLRRAMMFELAGIACYLITSLIIAASFVVATEFVLGLPLAAFVIGLICSFVGIVFAIFEISLAYRVMQLEVRAAD